MKQKILLLSMLLTLAACQPEASPPSLTEVASPSPIATEKVVPDTASKKPVVVAPAETPSSTAPTSLTVAADADAIEVTALALAKKSNCFLCHAIFSKVVGPAWKDVAAKYRDDVNAHAHLTNKIAKGGSGVWGSMAMPPQSDLSEAERNTLVDYILSLK